MTYEDRIRAAIAIVVADLSVEAWNALETDVRWAVELLGVEPGVAAKAKAVVTNGHADD